MKIRIGLDEAGRGCVLGPLFVASVIFESEDDDKYFEELGVKDSKQLAAKKREDLFEVITSKCSFFYDAVYPEQIDSENLNYLEFCLMTSLSSSAIEKSVNLHEDIPKFEIYIDCPETNCKKHAFEIKTVVSHSWIVDLNIISEHKADDKYIIVGASSIVAKVLRDREIKKIKKKYNSEYGDIGSGYPSDWKTKKFLEDFFRKNKSFPPEARMKWGTVEKIRRMNSENSEFNWKGSSDNIESC